MMRTSHAWTTRTARTRGYGYIIAEDTAETVEVETAETAAPNAEAAEAHAEATGAAHFLHHENGRRDFVLVGHLHRSRRSYRSRSGVSSGGTSPPASRRPARGCLFPRAASGATPGNFRRLDVRVVAPRVATCESKRLKPGPSHFQEFF
jgi:hypothetical protein